MSRNGAAWKAVGARDVDREVAHGSLAQASNSIRGRWEGDTLVVETRHIARSEEGSSFSRDAARIRAGNGGRTESLRVVERLTPVDADTLRYGFTVEDPTRWTRPWSGELPLRRTDESLFEYYWH